MSIRTKLTKESLKEDNKLVLESTIIKDINKKRGTYYYSPIDVNFEDLDDEDTVLEEKEVIKGVYSGVLYRSTMTNESTMFFSTSEETLLNSLDELDKFIFSWDNYDSSRFESLKKGLIRKDIYFTQVDESRFADPEVNKMRKVVIENNSKTSSIVYVLFEDKKFEINVIKKIVERF